MNRLKSYPLWLAIAGLIPMLVSALADYNILVVLPGNYDKLVIAVLGILVLAGIINNPTTEDHGFKDE